MQVQQLKVVQGKHVAAGDTLCTLMDNSVLYIEGMAFEQDIAAVNRAAAAGRTVSAVLGSKSSGDEEMVRGLRILYLDDKVERESRAFHFFVTLPNHLLRQDETPDGRRFVYWQFKPGQRTQIRIPVEQWTDRIVLPVEAVAQEGAESYVFEANDGHFDRRAVHVEYRDQESVVIANDGALAAGRHRGGQQRAPDAVGPEEQDPAAGSIRTRDITIRRNDECMIDEMMNATACFITSSFIIHTIIITTC